MQFAFLIWNIFLAFIPFIISRYLFLYAKPDVKKYFIFFGMGIWLLFFPNALYIVTDIVHLQNINEVPKWFDIILLFSASVLGLLLAFSSLHIIEMILKKYVDTKYIQLSVFTILFISSFGVYLGRFLRWNSWNIINKPFTLFQDIGERFLLPHEHIQTWSITTFLSILFYLLYFTTQKLSGFFK
ncbi:MAG: DUF1361 domain-containing protein [Chitinophagaceae bacterium]|nr:DUF1361 domain-containing protein [Chitinophagaceae bacterium]